MTKSLISKKNAAYIIAEIGQNHQGDFNEAKRYVEALAQCGVDAVKFQMRDNQNLFSKEKLLEPYNSPNSFGQTYGEHREFLELSFQEMLFLRDFSKELGIDFMCTPFDDNSLEKLIKINVDLIKIASFDFGNVPFIEKVIATKKHFVLSTGGVGYSFIDEFICWLTAKNANFSLLHCVSNYPCPPDSVNLGRIKYLKKRFPNLTIGLSDHFSGILTGPVGFLYGAKIFEKHVTFNRAQKGTDHSFALTIEGMKKFVRDINRVPELVGEEEPQNIGEEYVFQKLGKSIVADRKIILGENFSSENLNGLIIGHGIPVRNSMKLIGRKSKREYEKGEAIDISEINN